MQKQELLELYRQLMLARSVEEKIRIEYPKDDMKTPVHLGIGAEAIAVGVTHVFPKGTQYFASYRNHNLFLALTQDVDSFFGEMFGKATGCAKGKAGSMHMSSPEHGLVLTSAVVATTIPVAVGSAFAMRYRGENSAAVTFFGDGAIEEGVFWESLNFAALHHLKVLFVCEDNELAIHTPKKDRQGFPSLKEASKAFGCQYLEADGSDLNAVVQAAIQAKEFLANGPVVLKCDYHRFLQHVGPLPDYDAGYRSQPNNPKELDPVVVFDNYLSTQGITATEIQSICNELNTKIDQAVERARNAPFADSSEVTRDVYSVAEGK